MNFRFLGTGSGICPIKKKNTKEYRRRTSLLIDGKLLINPTVDIFDFESIFSLDGIYRSVEAIFVTDSTSLDVEAVGKLTERRNIAVYASAFVQNQLAGVRGVCPVHLSLFHLSKVGTYKVLPLPLAHHTENARECPFGLYISRDRNLLYATPGGMIRYDAWQLISKFSADESMKLDAIVLDCSRADAPFSAEDFDALSFEGASMNRRILESGGVTKEHCRFILANLPTSKKRRIHEEMLPLAEEGGFTLAYDGYFFGV